MKILLSIVLIFSFYYATAQGAIKKKRQLSDKVFFGMGMGLQFGTYTAIELTPMIGYMPINNLFFGAKGKYEYYKNNNINAGTSVYGYSIFGTYAFFNSVLAYAEYEAISLESAYFYSSLVSPDGDRYWLHSPLVGGGVLQSLGGRSKIMLLLLWNLNQTYGNYYSNPIVRVSFLF